MPDERTTQIRAALERILASPGFTGAGRLGPFLRYVVERGLKGDAAGLKESVLGVEVFQRSPDYDPRTDPIVRVEARRLRSRLEEYYSGDGASDPVRISLPKGGYVPVFEQASPQARKVRWTWVAAAAAIVALVLVWQFRPHRNPPPRQPSLAVFPFVNLNQDSADEYFSDGLTEELIDTVARVEGLRVAARSLTFQYKGKAVDVRQVGESLGATHVVEGTVRRGGDRLRISARLVSVADGYQLWSHSYERDTRDVFAVQEELARAIVGALQVSLHASAKELFAGRYTRNLEAYNHYLRARYQWNRFSKEGGERAIRELDDVLRLEPEYPPAYALLSSIYAVMGYYQYMPAAEAWPKAKAAAQRAIAADPGLPEAHSALSFVLGLRDWDWKGCERESLKSLELNPASADAHGVYAAACLMPQGRFSEAERQFARSLELDPLRVFTNFTAGYCYLAQGKHDLAAAQYRRTLDLSAEHPDIWWDYAMALGYAGKHAEAEAAFRRQGFMRYGASWEPGPPELVLMGRESEAREAVRRITNPLERFAGRQMDLARGLAMTGDASGALAALERAVDSHESQAVWIRSDPRLASVRSDPRYRQLLAKLGL